MAVVGPTEVVLDRPFHVLPPELEASIRSTVEETLRTAANVSGIADAMRRMQNRAAEAFGPVGEAL